MTRPTVDPEWDAHVRELCARTPTFAWVNPRAVAEAEAIAAKTERDKLAHRRQWSDFGARHRECCPAGSIDAIPHDQETVNDIDALLFAATDAHWRWYHCGDERVGRNGMASYERRVAEALGCTVQHAGEVIQRLARAAHRCTITDADLDAAISRGSAIKSVAELDARGAWLRGDWDRVVTG